MKKSKSFDAIGNWRKSIAAFLIAAFLSLGACTQSDRGTSIINKKCTRCHTTKRIYAHKRPNEEWRDIIERMIRHGANLSEEEKEFLIGYLSAKK